MTFEESHNSEEFKAARRQMMNGTLPEQCQICNKSLISHTAKDVLNSEMAHRIPEILEKTKEDGTTSVEPSFLDYRFITCNLICLTCNEFSSSRWRQAMPKIDPERPIPQVWTEWAQAEYKRVLKMYKWDRVYYAGGEPLMVPKHLEDLDYLAEQEKLLQKENPNTKTCVYYSTNLQAKPEFIEAWAERLSRFTDAGVYVSVDGYGRFNDLVRVGADFKKTEKNIELLKSKLAPHVRVSLYTVITSIFMLGLDAFVEWMQKARIELNCTMMFDSGIGRILRIENLALAYREKELQRWRERYSKMAEDDQQLFKNLDKMLNTHLLSPEFTEQEKRHNLELLAKTPFDPIKTEVRDLLLPFMGLGPDLSETPALHP